MQNNNYLLDNIVNPNVYDDELWNFVYQNLLEEYGKERVMLDHARAAFEIACNKSDNPLSVKELLRKVKLAWLWERPPLPRGIISGQR